MLIPHDGTAVRRETHIFDPDGEVNIILQCPEYHFAPWNDHEEPPAEELPTQGPPAEEPPVEEPVIFKGQLEEVCTSIVLYNKWEKGGNEQTKLTIPKY